MEITDEWPLWVLLTLVVAVFYLYRYRQKRILRRSGRRATARVTHVDDLSDDDDGSRYVIYALYTVDDQEYEGKFDASWMDFYDVGETVEILYWPDRPEVILPRSMVSGEPD